MKRIAILLASGAAAVTATLAIAQPQPIPGAKPPPPPHERSERGDRDDWRERRAERAEKRMDERLARLREDLKLTPEQAPLFDRLEAELKRGMKMAQESRAKWREQREHMRDADVMERIDMRAARLGERAERSKAFADAARPLWTTLSDPQKTTVRRAFRQVMHEGRGKMREMREMRGGWHEHRYEDRRGRGPRHERDRDRDRGYDDDGGRD